VTCAVGLRVSGAVSVARDCRRVADAVPSAKSLMALINTGFLSFCMGANYRPIGFEPIGRRFESVRARDFVNSADARRFPLLFGSNSNCRQTTSRVRQIAAGDLAQYLTGHISSNHK
jgi:hypothetical protein